MSKKPAKKSAAPVSADELVQDAEQQKSAKSSVTLESIRELADKTVEQYNEVQRISAELKKATEQFRHLAEKALPEAMDEIGLEQMKLKSGFEVSIEPLVQAGIARKNEHAALQWLKAHGYGDMIKHTVTVSFAQEEEKKADQFVRQLAKKNVTYKHDQKVHGQTLKAFVRTFLEREKAELEEDRPNVELPRDLFGVYESRVAKIEPPKGK